MTTMTEERDDALLVSVAGAGLISWKVLRWMRAVERVGGVQFRVVGGQLETEPGLPEFAQAFLVQHADELRRVVLATPTRLM